MLRDDRTATLDPDSLYHLALATNRVAGRAIVSDTELRRLAR